MAHLLTLLIRIIEVIIVVKRSKLLFIECVYEPGVMLSALHALFNAQKNPGGRYYYYPQFKVRKLKQLRFNDMIEVTQLALELGFEHRQSGSRVCVLNHYTIIVSLIIIRMS